MVGVGGEDFGGRLQVPIIAGQGCAAATSRANGLAVRVTSRNCRAAMKNFSGRRSIFCNTPISASTAPRRAVTDLADVAFSRGKLVLNCLQIAIEGGQPRVERRRAGPTRPVAIPRRGEPLTDRPEVRLDGIEPPRRRAAPDHRFARLEASGNLTLLAGKRLDRLRLCGQPPIDVGAIAGHQIGQSRNCPAFGSATPVPAAA